MEGGRRRRTKEENSVVRSSGSEGKRRIGLAATASAVFFEEERKGEGSCCRLPGKGSTPKKPVLRGNRTPTEELGRVTNGCPTTGRPVRRLRKGKKKRKTSSTEPGLSPGPGPLLVLGRTQDFKFSLSRRQTDGPVTFFFAPE